jgi:hypothetical protein
MSRFLPQSLLFIAIHAAFIGGVLAVAAFG